MIVDEYEYEHEHEHGHGHGHGHEGKQDGSDEGEIRNRSEAEEGSFRVE
jgi:hypothetical protein